MDCTTDPDAVAEYVVVLDDLSRHIANSNDLQSERVLMPLIAAAIGRGTRRIQVPALVDAVPPQSNDPVPSDFSPGKWARAGIENFLKTIGPQESFLCVDFLLVISVLRFNFAISTFLTFLDRQFQTSIEPIVRLTDVYLVSIFCGECMALLTLTAAAEVVRKLRTFRQPPPARR